MEISRELASNIVKEMKKIIDKDLNFINSEGIIIASTDETRVNTYHEGGKEAIKNNNIIKIIEDGEYKGTKKGINLPLKFNEDLIGVIGISGETKEVEKYGQIIKRMSEILIRENYLYRKEEREVEKDRILLEKILKNEEKEIYKNLIIKDIFKKLRDKDKVILSTKIDLKREVDIELLKNIFLEFRKIVKKVGGYCYLEGDIIYTLLFEYSNTNILEKIEQLEGIIKRINKECIINYGIGNIYKELEDLKKSYQESIIALTCGRKINKKYCFYSKMDLEILLNQIEENLQKEYCNKIFSNLSKEEIKEYKEIIKYYEKENGSLKMIAQELYMHVNTLQYKLNKFHEKTGLDIRKYGDFVKIKIATMLI